MATDIKTATVIPLTGTNYATWKVQVRMALMKESLWSIVNSTVVAPPVAEANEYAKFCIKRDKALAIIVLSVHPSLLYLLDDPEDPVVVWKKLQDQFQKKSWANKLQLKRRLNALRMREGESIQSHIKSMTEIFSELAIIGEPIKDEDKVVTLLASLPDSYNMLVTAFEANADVPEMDVVTEKLIHDEFKRKEAKKCQNEKVDSAFYSNNQATNKNIKKCHHCGKVGHIKKNCWKNPASKNFKKQQKANMVDSSETSGAECSGLLACQALAARSSSGSNEWVVDSGATCHMSNQREIFSEMVELLTPQKVLLGDKHSLDATGKGSVQLKMNLPGGKVHLCILNDVLFVPDLAYSLLSVPKATKSGKVVKFNENSCSILDSSQKLISLAKKRGELYFVDCYSCDYVNQATARNADPDGDLWHKRLGHLGVASMEKLAKENLLDNFTFKPCGKLSFCDSCTTGKIHKTPFPIKKEKSSSEILELVHSDVCGKLNSKSISGAEYFLTFIDDFTRYTWCYVIKKKDEVFEKFKHWKAEVENSTGFKLKILRSDNGGEYSSTVFKNFLKDEGVVHQKTIPKTPEQNGVSERMNRTLMESVRSMLHDAKLPHYFWAETLMTAVYLRNRSPTKALQNMTPYEKLKGNKPDVKLLRSFGCVAYSHIPNDERQKLDAKGRKCILLGYGAETKGYRLYDSMKKTVFFSRNVVFNETERHCDIENSNNQPLLSDTDDTEPPIEFESLEIDTTENESTELVDEVHAAPPDILNENRHSTRQRRAPDHYGEWVTLASNEVSSYKEAINSSEKDDWIKAMGKEMESMKTNKVWNLVNLPNDKKSVGCKWVYKKKLNEYGEIEKYKARLVAQGYSLKQGEDYDETFAPVVRFESIRTIIALATQHDMCLHQMDVSSAFLNGELDEEIYLRQPEGYAEKGKEHLVCRLNRSIYGLKQSPRCWNNTLDTYLKQLGFSQSSSDPCLYTSMKGELFVIAVYVDDIVLACKSLKRIEVIKKSLSERFQMHDLGEMTSFLGVKVVQNRANGTTWIGQPSFCENLLNNFSMSECKSAPSPAAADTKLVKADDSSEMTDQAQYQSAVGSLLFLSTRSRPDLSFAVANAARFCSNPTKEHWMSVKRIFRYIKGTINYGLLYKKDGNCDLVGYADADWAGDVNDRKSTSGYVFQLNGAPISWSSKKQTCVALSTAEAEYASLSSAAQETVWLRQLLSDVNCTSNEPTILLEDNQSAICMTKNPKYHSRSKHIDIKYHFVREEVIKGTIELQYCPTHDMIADVLTKGLSNDKFIRFRNMMGMAPLI